MIELLLILIIDLECLAMLQVGQVVDVSDGDERFDAAAFGRLERGGDADDAVDAVDGALSQEFVGSFYGSQNAAIAHYR